jgi:hypothetical protein
VTRHPRRRPAIEACLAALTAISAVVTAIDPEWIDLLFGVDPHGGSGALELAIVIVLAATSLTFAWMARRGLRRGLRVAREESAGPTDAA